MTIQAKRMPRVISYNGIKIADPNPSLPMDGVKDLLAVQFPEITTASIEGPEAAADGSLKYTFRRAVGAKG